MRNFHFIWVRARAGHGGAQGRISRLQNSRTVIPEMLRVEQVADRILFDFDQPSAARRRLRGPLHVIEALGQPLAEIARLARGAEHEHGRALHRTLDDRRRDAAAGWLEARARRRTAEPRFSRALRDLADIGSPHIADFVRAKRDVLKADLAITADGPRHSSGARAIE